jgi:hypothetical protein
VRPGTARALDALQQRRADPAMPDRRRTRTPTRPPTDPAAAPRPAWTPDQVRALGVTTDVVTAGQILGLSRNSAYRLAHAGTFPVPVLRAGAQYRVPVAALLTALGIDAERDTAARPDNAEGARR